MQLCHVKKKCHGSRTGAARTRPRSRSSRFPPSSSACGPTPRAAVAPPITVTSLERPPCAISGGGSITRPAPSSFTSNGRGVEQPLHAPRLGAERVAAAERLLDVGVPVLRRPDRHAALVLLGQDRAALELVPELGRDREAILRVQRVLELTQERQVSKLSSKGSRIWDGGVGGAPPSRSRSTGAAHYPTFPHFATPFPL